MIITYTFEVVASYIETFCGLLIIQGFIEKENIQPRFIIIISTVLTAAVQILNQFQLFSVATTFTGIFLMSICASILYNVKVCNLVPRIGVYMLLIYALDFCVISLLGSLFRIDNLALIILNKNSIWRKVVIIISKATLIVLSVVISKKKTFISVNIKTIWRLFIIGTFLNIFYLSLALRILI